MGKEPISSDFDDSDVTERIRRLVRQLRILHERINRIEEFAYTILALLEELVQEVDTNHVMAPTAAPGRPGRTIHDRTALRRMAESGVASAKIERHVDGTASIRIDHHDPFELPPILADLLEILCRDAGRITDEMVGWKPREEVRILLSKAANREITEHALTNSIYRLRSELESRGGVNPFLLQTTKRDGIRFAVLRPGHSTESTGINQ